MIGSSGPTSTGHPPDELAPNQGATGHRKFDNERSGLSVPGVLGSPRSLGRSRMELWPSPTKSFEFRVFYLTYRTKPTPFQAFSKHMWLSGYHFLHFRICPLLLMTITPAPPHVYSSTPWVVPTLSGLSAVLLQVQPVYDFQSLHLQRLAVVARLWSAIVGPCGGGRRGKKRKESKHTSKCYASKWTPKEDHINAKLALPLCTRLTVCRRNGARCAET